MGIGERALGRQASKEAGRGVEQTKQAGKASMHVVARRKPASVCSYRLDLRSILNFLRYSGLVVMPCVSGPGRRGGRG